MTRRVPSEAGQPSSADEQNPRSVSRRDVLAGTAATLASALIPTVSFAAAGTPRPAAVLTATERRSLQAAVSRIIPNSPQNYGALEAGCADYIELSLSNAYRSLLATYRTGFAALDAHANSKAGKSFATLSGDQQDQLLADFEQNVTIGDFSASGAFFEILRRHTLEGMFGDPSYGGNKNFAGWDLIGYPGPRMLVRSEMQSMNAKIPRSRLSVKQLDHGSP